MPEKWKKIKSSHFKEKINKGKVNSYLGNKYQATEIKIDDNEYDLGKTSDKKELIKLFMNWSKNNPSADAFGKILKNKGLSKSKKLINLRKDILEEANPSKHEVPKYVRQYDKPAVDARGVLIEESSAETKGFAGRTTDEQEFLNKIKFGKRATLSIAAQESVSRKAVGSTHVGSDEPKISALSKSRISGNNRNDNIKTSAASGNSGFVRPF